MSKYNILFPGLAPIPFEPSFQKNYALHRAIGGIPGCVPAVDVFKDTFVEQVRVELAVRSDTYCKAIAAYCAGEYGGDNGEAEMWHDSGRTKPLLGAYGEAIYG